MSEDDLPQVIAGEVVVFLELAVGSYVRDVHVQTMDSRLFEGGLYAVHPIRST